MPAAGEVTRLLGQLSGGDRSALDRLVPLVYAELHALAEACFRGENAGNTLQPTALLHEAYLRLVEAKGLNFDDRRQFFAVAATVMRRVLIDHGRTRAAAKRGGHRTTLEDWMAVSEGGTVDAFALAQALERLDALDPDLCRVFELRCFGGLSVEEAASALHVSAPTVKRRWSVARAWLARELGLRSKARGV
jgi:RNA polymerase sigma factor (TIGR02999 family)